MAKLDLPTEQRRARPRHPRDDGFSDAAGLHGGAQGVLVLAAQLAQDDDDTDELLKEPTKKTETADAKTFSDYGDEDDEFADFKVAPEPVTEEEKDPGSVTVARGSVEMGENRATQLPYDVVGKTPLKDNYKAQVLYVDRDSVVIELPVLLARQGSDFDGHSYWLGAEIYADGVKIGEARQQVTQQVRPAEQVKPSKPTIDEECRSYLV